MKKDKWVWLGLILVILSIVLTIWLKNRELSGSDYRIGVFGDDGVAVVSISKSRQMINVLKVSPEAKMWIPGGMGWYRSEVVKKILNQENKKDLFDQILFCNFGLVADRIISVRKVDDWQTRFWWRVKSANLITKNEVLNKDSDVDSDWLDKIMLRDFSESKVFDEDLKISVINVSEENGLAGFVTKGLERMGFSVVSVTSEENTEMADGCVVLYGEEVEEKYSWVLLKRLFNCNQVKEPSLNSGEVELYFDDKFASMIQYPSYKK